MKNLEEFLEDLKANEELRAQLAAAGEDKEAVNKVLADNGYAVTGDDIMEFAKQFKSDRLSKDQVRAIAGGFWLDSPGASVNVPSGIACIIVGAGCTCWLSFGEDEK